MRNLFTTRYAMQTALEKSARSAVEFLLKTPSVKLSDGDLHHLTTLKSGVDTPITELFPQAVAGKNLLSFLPLDLTTVTTSIPVVLTYDEVSINGTVLPNCPRDLQKVWINLSPAMTARKDPRAPIRFNDISKVMGYFVRGKLSSDYDTTPEGSDWINPKHAAFIIQTFAEAAHMRIARLYNLDVHEGRMVMTAFAYHYAKLLGQESDNSKYPYLLNRCGFLGSAAEIAQRIDMMTDALDGKDLHSDRLGSICEALAAVGPGRMRDRFNVGVFYQSFGIGSIDTMTTAIAAEYPPYWIFMLLKYASGAKIPLLSTLFKLGYLKRNLKPSITDLIKDRNLMR
jgi:hypothetical protein